MPLRIHLNLLRAVLLAAVVSTPAFAQSAPPSAAADADAIIALLKSQAAAGHKDILLTFGASWCGNCRKFDKFLADPAIHPILDRAFVFGDMASGERSTDKRHTNTPGAVALQSTFGGNDAGYPFIVMLDANGRLIANSLRPTGHGSTENTGYPDAPYEIDWFMVMLKSAVPTLSAQDAAIIRNWLSAHSSSH
jgi:hypothetical protein